MAVYDYDEIYKQYLDNYKKTAEKQNAAEQAAAEKAKADNAAVYEKSNQQLQKQAEYSKSKVRTDYNEIYDSNAVNQYVREAKLAESMANAGLTDSGLNTTQMTAIQTSRGNADSRTRIAEQAAIDAIEQQLAAGIAENEQKIAEYNSSVDAKVATNKADRIASAESDAVKDTETYYNKLLDYEQKAQTTRNDNISGASAALKNYAENASDDNEIFKIVKKYAAEYNMTDTEIMTMCNNAGVNYYGYKEYKNNYDARAKSVISKFDADVLSRTEFSARGRATVNGITYSNYQDYIKAVREEWYKNGKIDEESVAALAAYYGY